MYKGVWSDETKRTKQKRRTKNVKKRDRHKWSKKEGLMTKRVGSGERWGWSVGSENFTAWHFGLVMSFQSGSPDSPPS